MRSIAAPTHTCRPIRPGEAIDIDGWGSDPRMWLRLWSTASPPVRLSEPRPAYSAGRHLAGQVYVVGWRDRGIVKIGSTRHGRRRYGTYLARGAEVVTLANYQLGDECYAEVWLQQWAGKRYATPFCRAECCASALGLSSGAGWTEMFAAPAEDWPAIDAALGRSI